MESITNSISAVLTAIAGGLSRFMLLKEYSTIQLVILLITSAFTGYITFLLCSEYDLSVNLTSAICGMTGFSSRSILPYYEKMVFSCILIRSIVLEKNSLLKALNAIMNALNKLLLFHFSEKK